MLLIIINFAITYLAPLIPFVELIFTFIEKFSKKKERDIQFVINEMNGDINIVNNQLLVTEQRKLEKQQQKAEISKRNKQWFQKHSYTLLSAIMIVSFVFYFVKSFLSIPDPTEIYIFELYKSPVIKALFFSFVMTSRNFLLINTATCITFIIKNLFVIKLSIINKIISFIYFGIILYLNSLLLNNAYIDNNFKNFNLALESSDITKMFEHQSPLSIIFFFVITLLTCSILIHNYFETTKVTTDMTTSVPILSKYTFVLFALFFGAWYFSPTSFPFHFLSEHLQDLIQKMKQTS